MCTPFGNSRSEQVKSTIVWNQLKIGEDETKDDSTIEYLDVEETNMKMIAMKYDDLKRGSLLPIKYTHLEIHQTLY